VYVEGTGNANNILESNGIGADVGRPDGNFNRSPLHGFGLAIQKFLLDLVLAAFEWILKECLDFRGFGLLSEKKLC
jgi:hypothetical protein